MKEIPHELKVHVVSHTHWDREWRQPFEFFQPYLVKCLDQLFSIFEENDDYRAFLLDGQAVMLEDYLEVRPERTEDVRKWLEEKRLFVGPWYSLIDNNLVDPESIVRNLLYGTRLSKKYGACMKEGYLISSFGHCGQIPQIFAGFGIHSILFSRGISEWQTRSELLWEAPDGTRALALHLPDRYTKSNWFYLVHRPGCVGRDAMDWKYRWPADGPVHAADAESANHYWWRTRERFLTDEKCWIECVENLIEKCLSVSSIPILLAMDGVDHLFPHKDVPAIIRTANQHFGREVLVHSSLPAYIEEVRKCIEKDNVELEVKTGEMRRPMKVPGFNQLLAGTASARMRMKLLNSAAETALIRLAEPLCSLSFLHGSEYPKPFLDQAWKLLMKNHAHDGICGTSTDAVHDAMADRYKRARNLADFLSYEAMKELAVQIDTTRLEKREMALTVFNTAGFRRSPVIRAVVDIPYEWNASGVTICDLEGVNVPFLLLTKQKQEREILADHEAQLGFLCLRIELEFLASDLPSFGYKTFIVKPGPWLNKSIPERIGRQLPCRTPGPRSIENEYLHITAESDGSLTMIDKCSGRIFSGLNVLASSGDIGDSTLYLPPMEDSTLFSSGFNAGIEIVESGPLRASLKITWKMEIPACCEPRAKFVELVETAQPFKARRSRELVEETVSSCVTLSFGSRRVEVKTVVENRARDHRLRVLFPSGASKASSWIADAPFDIVKRDISLPDTTDWAEPWPETQPIRSWCAVSDGERGLALFCRGIPEAACIDDSSRTIAFTLLRSTRRSIGEDYSLEGPQSLGTHIFEYAIQPFGGEWTEQGFPRAAADFLTPPRAVLSASGREGTLPLEREIFCLEVEPEKSAGNLALAAIKKAEEGEGLILRLSNPSPEPLSVSVIAHEDLAPPRELQLDETPCEGESRESIPLDPQRIVTLSLMKRTEK